MRRGEQSEALTLAATFLFNYKRRVRQRVLRPHVHGAPLIPTPLVASLSRGVSPVTDHHGEASTRQWQYSCTSYERQAQKRRMTPMPSGSQPRWTESHTVSPSTCRHHWRSRDSLTPDTTITSHTGRTQDKGATCDRLAHSHTTKPSRPFLSFKVEPQGEDGGVEARQHQEGQRQQHQPDGPQEHLCPLQERQCAVAHKVHVVVHAEGRHVQRV